MEIKLPEIQAIIDELKNDSQVMAKAEVRTTVEQLDQMLNELDLNQTLTAPIDTSETQTSIKQIEGLIAQIPQIFEVLSHPEPLLSLLLQTAIVYRRMGEIEQTVKCCEQVLSLTEDGKYPKLRAETYRQLGHLQFYQGQWNQAEAYYQQSLALFEAEGDVGGVASIYNRLGDIASRQGDYERAQSCHQRVIDMAQQDDRRLLATAYRSLGIIAIQQNNWEAAIDYCEQSINIYEKLGLLAEAAGVLMNLAMAYVDCEEWETAGACYAEATEMAEKSGNLFLLSQIYINRAEFLLNIVSIDAAKLYCDKALEIFQKSKNNNGIAEAYKLYGRIHRHQKDFNTAIRYFTQSIELYQACQNPQGEAEGCYEFGTMYRDCQNFSQARHFLQKSRSLYEFIGATDEIKRVEGALAELEGKTTS